MFIACRRVWLRFLLASVCVAAGATACGGSSTSSNAGGGDGGDAVARQDVGTHSDTGTHVDARTDAAAHSDAHADGATHGDAGADAAPDGGLTCQPFQAVCGAGASAFCASVQVDPDNCGGCGTKCASGTYCSEATCGASCIGLTSKLCSDTCVDPVSDNKNCGSCGDACPAGQVCSASTCAATCASAYATCGTGASAYCAITNIDPDNCGACGVVCGKGELCSTGTCGATCGGATTKCNGLCVNTATDDANCGACGTACAAGTACVSGACAESCAPSCPDGNACGAPGDCSSGICTEGKCAPPACSPTCPDGNACESPTVCGSGVCTAGKCAAPACAPACSDGKPCGAAGDCASGVCTGGTCAAPACAPACAAANPCGANGDCASDLCTANVCAACTISTQCAMGQSCVDGNCVTLSPVLPASCTRATAGSDGRIYALQDSGALYAMKPGDTSWTVLATAPAEQANSAVAWASGKLYSWGRTVGGVGSTTSAAVYTPGTNTWSGTIAVLPTNRTGAVAATGPDGLVYVIGGASGSNGTNNYVLVGVTEAYNPTTDTWVTTAPPMPTPRFLSAVAVGTDKRIYVIGGSTTAGNAGYTPVATVDAFDTTTQTWSAVANLPKATYWSAGALGADGQIYSVGGNTGATTGVVNAFNGTTWQTVAPLPTPRYCAGGAALPGADPIFAIAGTVGVVETFATVTGVWN